jgi:hypothetical protein
MSSDDVLGQIMNHEMYIKEANHVKNLSKGSLPQGSKRLLSRLTRRARTIKW